PPLPTPTLSPYTTLFRSDGARSLCAQAGGTARRRIHDPRARRQLSAAGRGLLLLYADHGHPEFRLGAGLSAGEGPAGGADGVLRSEEHTSELQSRENLVC